MTPVTRCQTKTAETNTKVVGRAHMDRLRSELEAALGEIYELEPEAPGVWYCAFQAQEWAHASECYLVEQDSGTISEEAKRYGAELTECPGPGAAEHRGRQWGVLPGDGPGRTYGGVQLPGLENGAAAGDPGAGRTAAPGPGGGH